MILFQKHLVVTKLVVTNKAWIITRVIKLVLLMFDIVIANSTQSDSNVKYWFTSTAAEVSGCYAGRIPRAPAINDMTSTDAIRYRIVEYST